MIDITDIEGNRAYYKGKRMKIILAGEEKGMPGWEGTVGVHASAERIQRRVEAFAKGKSRKKTLRACVYDSLDSGCQRKYQTADRIPDTELAKVVMSDWGLPGHKKRRKQHKTRAGAGI